MILADCRGVERIRLDVFARLPEEFRRRTGQSEWAVQMGKVNRPEAFLEGPVVDRAGGLYVVDVAWGRIFHVDAEGRFSLVIEYSGAPNGLAWGGPEQLMIADHHLGLLALADIGGSPVLTVVANGLGADRFRGLNDLVVNSSGELLITDQGGSGLQDPTGRLLGYSAESGWRVLLGNVPSPNGIAVAQDGSCVYLAVTRDNSVWRLPIRNDRSVTKVGRFLQFSGGEGPDGLAIGPGGTLLVAHLGTGCVWVVDSRGFPRALLEASEGFATTNVAVDADARVFVTESETNTILTASIASIL